MKRSRPRFAPRRRARRRAFTLLEVLLAVSVGAMLLISVIGLAFSMGELWGNTSEPRLFAQHVRGVSRFLDNLLRQAEPPPEAAADLPGAESEQQEQRQLERQAQQLEQGMNGPGTGVSRGTSARSEGDARVAWYSPPGRQYGTEEFLTFELPESPGIFAWPEDALPFVVCSLRVDPGEGLFLLWKSRLEEDFADEAPREFRVSPFVTGITYWYFDTEQSRPKWEKAETPRSTGGTRELPARIELTFEYEGEKLVTALVIPPAAAAVPVY